MVFDMWNKLYSQKSSLTLVIAMLAGGILGVYAPDTALLLKPVGQIFLNLLFMIIVPLVGVSVVSSIMKMTNLKTLGSILTSVLAVSMLMAAVSTIFIVIAALLFHPAQGTSIELNQAVDIKNVSFDVVSMITVNDFSGLFSRNNILALIIVAVITGIAIGQTGDSGKALKAIIENLNQVILNVLNIIMIFAPLGLGAYFAATMASQDIEVLSSYARSVSLYFIVTIIYFVVASSFYSWLAGGKQAVKRFWGNVLEPALTALGTCSSLGTMPVTIRTAKKMGIKEETADICLPLLVNFNKGGAAMITALKIVFIYSLLGLDFTPGIFITTLLVSMLSSIVISGIPSGTFVGSAFIVSVLGLPTEVIPVFIIIGTLTDAPATLLNVVNDLNAAQLIEKILRKRSKSVEEINADSAVLT